MRWCDVPGPPTSWQQVPSQCGKDERSSRVVGSNSQTHVKSNNSHELSLSFPQRPAIGNSNTVLARKYRCIHPLTPSTSRPTSKGCRFALSVVHSPESRFGD